MYLKTIRRKGGSKAGVDFRIKKEVHTQLVRLWKDSLAEFLETAIRYTLIDTAMSRASFMPLAQAASLGSLVSESLHGRGKRKGYYDMNGNYYPGQFRSKTKGMELGRRAYEFKVGTANRINLQFEFNIVVYQHYLHEFGLGRHSPAPGGQQGLEKGKRAFLEYFNSNYTRYVTVGPIYDILARS